MEESLSKPFFSRLRYSGSFASSLPVFNENIAATITPTKVAGIDTLRMSKSEYPKGLSSAKSATVAADIGLAVIAC